MLDPKRIPKFVSELPIPPVFAPKTIETKDGRVWHNYEIVVRSFDQQLLPEGFPKTSVYGYGGWVKDKNGTRFVQQTPGPTFEATRGIPARVKWINQLDERHFLPVDGTIHWANPDELGFPPKNYPIPFNPKTREGIPEIQTPIPIVTHLHGGENPPQSDGDPEAWFTKGLKKKGNSFYSDSYTYLNFQPPTTLWYHDHTLGMTRLNVYAGLAGFYLIKDPKNTLNDHLPADEFDLPLVLQDRKFSNSGQLLEIENVGSNPSHHPYWTAESLGNTNMVNGKVWPNLNVQRRLYRFRLLNGSNGRYYRLSFPFQDSKLSFIQIASDGGFLPQPVKLTEVLLAPAERVEILIDFSDLEAGNQIRMKNDAKSPFSPEKPPLDPSDPITDVMQLTVIPSTSVSPHPLPKKLNVIPELKPNAPKRLLTLNEVPGPTGKPLMLLLNGQKWGAHVSEQPLVGSTEDWQFINLTNDTHPMHLHLVQFQIISRQPFDRKRYFNDWKQLNGELPLKGPTKSLAVEGYVTGDIRPPDPNEAGWHDIVSAHPNEITTIRVRFAPILLPEGGVVPGENNYPFNPGVKPGYVWHCHILDHEDNEMMRPYQVDVPLSTFKESQESTTNKKGSVMRERDQDLGAEVGELATDNIQIAIYFNASKLNQLTISIGAPPSK